MPIGTHLATLKFAFAIAYMGLTHREFIFTNLYLPTFYDLQFIYKEALASEALIFRDIFISHMYYK